jgi:hypothetical protein
VRALRKFGTTTSLQRVDGGRVTALVGFDTADGRDTGFCWLSDDLRVVDGTWVIERVDVS